MQDRLLSERLNKTKKSVLLLGPRQVGKSTLCASLKPDQTINLADEEAFLSYAKEPYRLKREIAALQKPSLILIDEIQRVPALLNMVQVLVDQGQPKHRFLLTGSSAKKLKSAGANLLPGRIVLENLDPLSYLELSGNLDLARALQIGMLPGVYLGEEDVVETLGTYVEVYLREEIRAEALAKDVGTYARFLDVAAILSGQWINYSKVSSETEIPKETIRRYFSILEDTLMIFRIPAFRPKRSLGRRVSQKDKFLFFDIGVRNSLLKLHKRPPTIDQQGALFEQWFILQLIYMNRALHLDWEISTYRTDGGAEVDIVLEREDDIVGIEIKSSRNVGASDLRGLQSLSETVGKYKPVKPFVAYRGEKEQVFENGARAVPFLRLLERLAGR